MFKRVSTSLAVLFLLTFLYVFGATGVASAHSLSPNQSHTTTIHASSCAGTLVEGPTYSHCFYPGYNGDNDYNAYRVDNYINAVSWIREYPNNGSTGYFVNIQPGGHISLNNAKVTQVCVACGYHS